MELSDVLVLSSYAHIHIHIYIYISILFLSHKLLLHSPLFLKYSRGPMPPAARPALPSNLNQWNTEARNHGVSDTSIHDLLDFDSASKIGPRQYYSLRVLWVVAPKLPDASFLDLSQDDPNYRKASDFLSNKSQSWKDYLKDIKDKPGLSSANKAQDIGAFSNVRYYQLHVDPSTTASSSTPDKDMESVPSKFSRRYPPSAIPASTTSMTQTTPLKGQQSIESRFFSDFNTPFNDNSLLSVDSFKPPTPQTPATPRTTAPAEDEQIVNVALVLWLQTLTMFHTGVQEGGLKWSMKRLKLDFDTWEARTDGCLRRKQEIKAILEVKPFVRQKCLDLIQEQETAQMCAWIRNFPDVGGWSVVKRGGKFERSVQSAIHEMLC